MTVGASTGLPPVPPLHDEHRPLERAHPGLDQVDVGRRPRRHPIQVPYCSFRAVTPHFW